MKIGDTILTVSSAAYTDTIYVGIYKGILNLDGVYFVTIGRSVNVLRYVRTGIAGLQAGPGESTLSKTDGLDIHVPAAKLAVIHMVNAEAWEAHLA